MLGERDNHYTTKPLTIYSLAVTVAALQAGGVEPPKSGLMHRGHHKGAKNVFYDSLRDPETNCFKSEKELAKREPNNR